MSDKSTYIKDYVFYVINMEKDVARKEFILKQLLDLNVENEQIKIIKAFTPKSRLKYRTTGEHGCAVSHFEVIKQIYEEKIENFLIVEDDCIFLKAFSIFFGEYIHSTKILDYESIFFRRPYDVKNTMITSKYIYCSKNQKRVCTECYSLSPEMVEKIISLGENYFINGTPVDHWYFRNTRVVNPVAQMVRQNKDFKTNIQLISQHKSKPYYRLKMENRYCIPEDRIQAKDETALTWMPPAPNTSSSNESKCFISKKIHKKIIKIQKMNRNNTF